MNVSFDPLNEEERRMVERILEITEHEIAHADGRTEYEIQQDEVRALCVAYGPDVSKIPLIKECRIKYDMGLKEAKDLVESVWPR